MADFWWRTAILHGACQSEAVHCSWIACAPLHVIRRERSEGVIHGASDPSSNQYDGEDTQRDGTSDRMSRLRHLNERPSERPTGCIRVNSRSLSPATVHAVFWCLIANFRAPGLRDDQRDGMTSIFRSACYCQRSGFPGEGATLLLLGPRISGEIQDGKTPFGRVLRSISEHRDEKFGTVSSQEQGILEASLFFSFRAISMYENAATLHQSGERNERHRRGKNTLIDSWIARLRDR